MKGLLYILGIMLCLSSCNGNGTVEGETNIDTTQISKSLLAQIDLYMENHPNIKSVVILTNIDMYWKEEIPPHHFWAICPAYENVAYMTNGNSPSFFFKYKGIRVFIQSSFDGVFNFATTDRAYKQFCIKGNHQKDIFTEQDILENAMVIKQNGVEQFYFISSRADTFLAKKRIDFTPPPVKGYKNFPQK